MPVGRERPELRIVPEGCYPSWDAVYDDNVTWVYRMLYARLGSRADAEDLTSEVFLAALRPLRLSASVAEVRSYLRTTARTVLAAHWRATMGREITMIEDDVAAAEFESDGGNSTAPQRPHFGSSLRRAAMTQPALPRSSSYTHRIRPRPSSRGGQGSRN